MYVNPFLLGVLCTIGVEAVAVIVCAAIAIWRSDNE